MKEIKYITKNVCSKQINIIVDGEVIHKVEFIGGCPGNANGLSRLVSGLTIEEVIRKLTGVKCKGDSSCPDQLAKALAEHTDNK